MLPRLQVVYRSHRAMALVSRSMAGYEVSIGLSLSLLSTMLSGSKDALRLLNRYQTKEIQQTSLNTSGRGRISPKDRTQRWLALLGHDVSSHSSHILRSALTSSQGQPAFYA
jgi:hypothetical protein